MTAAIIASAAARTVVSFTGLYKIRNTRHGHAKEQTKDGETDVKKPYPNQEDSKSDVRSRYGKLEELPRIVEKLAHEKHYIRQRTPPPLKGIRRRTGKIY